MCLYAYCIVDWKKNAKSLANTAKKLGVKWLLNFCQSWFTHTQRHHPPKNIALTNIYNNKIISPSFEINNIWKYCRKFTKICQFSPDFLLNNTFIIEVISTDEQFLEQTKITPRYLLSVFTENASLSPLMVSFSDVLFWCYFYKYIFLNDKHSEYLHLTSITCSWLNLDPV